MSDTATRRTALILCSSADQLPLSSPAGQSINIGWFLVELGAVLERFQDTHDFIFAAPDGRTPTLDINGMALSMHGGAGLGPATLCEAVEQALGADDETLRAKNAGLLARRDRELAMLRTLIGPMPVSEPLPRTDREAAAVRPEIVASLAGLPERHWYSIPELLARHRDESDEFSLGSLDFMHAPGGHAPMVDFHDTPVVGELLHSLRENDVPISLICHAPVAMTSARYRVGADGAVTVNEDHEFKGAHITTVLKYGELGMLALGYPKVPGQRTRLEYFVDEAPKDAGYDVSLSLNPSAVKVVWDAEHGLLTGNGPQSTEAQAYRLAQILREREQARATDRA